MPSTPGMNAGAHTACTEADHFFLCFASVFLDCVVVLVVGVDAAAAASPDGTRASNKREGEAQRVHQPSLRFSLRLLFLFSRCHAAQLVSPSSLSVFPGTLFATKPTRKQMPRHVKSLSSLALQGQSPHAFKHGAVRMTPLQLLALWRPQQLSINGRWNQKGANFASPLLFLLMHWTGAYSNSDAAACNHQSCASRAAALSLVPQHASVTSNSDYDAARALVSAVFLRIATAAVWQRAQCGMRRHRTVARAHDLATATTNVNVVLGTARAVRDGVVREQRGVRS